MARHQRMPTLEAGYTYAVVPCLPEQIACNEEESIYGSSVIGSFMAQGSSFEPESLGILGRREGH